MVELSRQGKQIYVNVKGFHKLWAFRSGLVIPEAHIVNAYVDEAEVRNFRGVRMLGTSLPYVLCAGNFITQEGNVFCDFSDVRRTIVIHLRNEYYCKLIVEVKDPAEAVYFLANRRY